MSELKLSGRTCVFCKNPARWRGEAVKKSDYVSCGNCMCHSSIGQIMRIERALKLLKLAGMQKKYYDERGYTPENNKAYEVLDYLLEESKQ